MALVYYWLPYQVRYDGIVLVDYSWVPAFAGMTGVEFGYYWIPDQAQYDGMVLVDYSWIGFAVALGDPAFAGMTGVKFGLLLDTGSSPV